MPDKPHINQTVVNASLPLSGGSMAALVKAMDWSKTPLGPIESWPECLRVAVELCLSSRFSMHVWWGPGFINIYNDAHIPVLGARHPKALGRSAPKVWADVWPLLTPQIEAVMLRGESTWNERTHVVLERSGFAEDAWFTWSYSPIRDEAGQVRGLMCIATEDTARVLAERERDRLEEQRRQEYAGERAKLAAIVESSDEALARQAEELARSNVELERFAYVASHDLQEPMRTVHSFTTLLQRRHGDKLSGDAMEFLTFITQGVQRMQALINDLLAYSRVNSQGAAFAKIDCGETVVKVLANLRASIDAADAKVSVDALPVVLGDATQLGQVFQNLMGNALKFRGKDPPRIRVWVQQKTEEWIFGVSDNGIGIAPEYFERIFIIFQRLHTIEEYGGTGIGLAICKKIVERHGGRIWVESTPREGSTFYFSIPKKNATG